MKSRVRKLLAASVIAIVMVSVVAISTPAVASFLNPGIPSGAGVTAAVESGFPGCSEGLTAYTWQGSLNGTRTTPEGLEITVSKTGQSLPGRDSRYFDFSVDGGDISEVVVKTNVFIVGFITASNVYSYDDPIDADTKLHPPVDYKNRPFSLDKVRFCYEPTVKVSGIKFHDLDADGVRDEGEPGLSGWEITANQGEAVVATTNTGEGGSYTFDDLPSGSYTICESVEEGWHQSYPAADGCHAVGGSSDGLDFGNYRNGTIAGVKFEDVNANGVNNEEPGLEGWIITATPSAGADETAETDSEGLYSITVKPGAYTVCEETVARWVQSFPGEEVCHQVAVTSGETVANVDFGNYQLGSISGQRLINGEGFPNQDVTLLGGEAPVSTTTDEIGGYSFDGLPPGTYTVCTGDLGATTPSGATCDEGQVGTEVVVDSGAAVAEVDFVDTVEDASVVPCTTDGAITGGSGLPEGTASAYCETKDGEPLESIAIVYTSGFDVEGFAQRIDLEILGTPITTQFVETLDFVPEARTSEEDVEPVLEYDDGRGYRDALFCKVPVEASDLPVADPDLVLPVDETMCIVDKTVSVVDPPVEGEGIYIDIDFLIFWTQDPTRGFR